MKTGAFTSSLPKQARKVFDMMPNDGCILVFNAVHLAFRKELYHNFRGLLSVSVCERLPKGERIRDLYITWRE